MIIQCPYCATSYQLDPARLVGKSPVLKCSRCDNVFPAPSGKAKKRPAPAPPAPAGGPPAAEKNLPLPFDEPGWKEDTE
ncbi:MAG: zinc-ribbon domain, partial [Deltaproteobacteria bacterium]|nr:zinc-ribbon domain [Deltaproteobacteria bacterium]